MTNETSISRATVPDPVSVLNRKKSNSDSIDISKLSFFDELLSIGQFVSTIPESTSLPSELPLAAAAKSNSDSTTGGVDDASSDEPEEIDKETDTSSGAIAQAFAQQQFVAQSPNPDAKKVSSEQLDPIQGATQQKPIAQSEKHTSSETTNEIDPQQPGGESVPNAVNSDQQNTLGLAAHSADLKNTDPNSQPISLDAETAEDDGKNALALSDDAIKNKPIQKGRTSSNASDENTEQSKTGQDISLLTPVANDETEDSVLTLQEFETTNEQAEKSTDLDEPAIDAEQPRNRRSERLAERASANDSSSDQRDPSSESQEAIDSQVSLAATEPRKDESFLSATTLSTPLAPPTAITPSFTTTVPISNTFSNTFSNTATSATSNARAAIDGVSAVTTSSTGGGTQTTTIGTTISGTSPSSSRSESGRGEVARSNSGTQITAYQEIKLVQRVLRGVEQLANGGGQVRLRLHPAELGSLQISLRVEAGQVSAKLEVENATARDALLSNVQTLKDRLAEQGIKVGSFEVEVSADSNGSGTANSNFQSDGGSSGQSYRENATSRFAQQNNNRLPIDSAQPERTPPTVWSRNNGSLDLTV